jgi:hypothetical protein
MAGLQEMLASIESLVRPSSNRVFATKRTRRPPSLRRRIRAFMQVLQWWPVALVVAVLFALGLILGGLDNIRSTRGASYRPAGWMRALGVGGPVFEVTVKSSPEGAAILVDGSRLDRRTPASVWLAPGEHKITLELGEFGSTTQVVSGQRDQVVAMSATLWGTIEVQGSSTEVPCRVTVGGRDAGFAPTTIDSVAPGLVEVHYVVTGAPPWSELVKVRANEVSTVTPRSPVSPALGKVSIRALMIDDLGTHDVDGARVWIDGHPRGETPLTLELPRGPHSFRARYLNEDAAVQVLSLPGGNMRFVKFEFGSDVSQPRLALLSALTPSREESYRTVTAQLTDVGEQELREMWLHLRVADGRWRRYPMTLLRGPGGPVGVGVIPADVASDNDRPPYYVSAITKHGDEYFTEIQTP